MNEQNTTIPKSFRIIAVIGLIWNGLGILNFVGQTFMSEETLAAMPEDQQALFENVPMWITILFALAVITGTLGCIGLLMKKSWAVPLFLVSMIAAVVQMLHGLFMTEMVSVMGTPAIITTFLVIIISISLYWYSRQCKAKGWLS